jgi:hypothetical protein
MTKSKKERFPKDGITETIVWLTDFIERLEHEKEVLGLRRDNDYFSRSYLYLIRQSHQIKKELFVLDEQYYDEFLRLFRQYHHMRQPATQGGKEVLESLIEISKSERAVLRHRLTEEFR